MNRFGYEVLNVSGISTILGILAALAVYIAITGRKYLNLRLSKGITENELVG